MPLMTLAITFISGVAAFLLGQYALKLVIEPLLALRAHIGTIGCQLIYFADSFSREDLAPSIRQEFRKSASRLVELAYGPILYSLVHKWFCLPSISQVMEAASQLIGLSNTLGSITPDDPKEQRIMRIRELLGLPLL